MTAQFKISVVICTYNRASYIREAMESLYTQTLDRGSYEVIVVNNNSTDTTAMVCGSFIESHNDARFVYLNEAQQGASFARNTGARHAQSPLLCFMDDDAVADPDYLERMSHFLLYMPMQAVWAGGSSPAISRRSPPG
jgi:glycosyltransferase involved in cell wall biosynthesis